MREILGADNTRTLGREEEAHLGQTEKDRN